jgi:hypothetical protein
VNAERHSLADAFKPASQTADGRGASLEGLLSPKRKPVSVVPGRPAGPEARAPESPKEAKAAQTTRAKSSEQASGAIRNVGVYLPPVLLEKVRDMVRSHQTTYADLLVEAFDVIDERTLAKAFETDSQQPETGMPRRIRRPRGAAGIQINVRLDDQQVRWIDEKMKRMEAPSRSAFITAVYKLYLEKEAD